MTYLLYSVRPTHVLIGCDSCIPNKASSPSVLVRGGCLLLGRRWQVLWERWTQGSLNSEAVWLPSLTQGPPLPPVGVCGGKEGTHHISTFSFRPKYVPVGRCGILFMKFFFSKIRLQYFFKINIQKPWIRKAPPPWAWDSSVTSYGYQP